MENNCLIYISIGLNCLLLIFFIINIIKNNKKEKEYTRFMKKLGNGNNIEEILKTQLNKIEKLEIKNEELKESCNRLNREILKCIKKVGIVRYSAFKDVGSDLSFALAMLDEENSGVILNGIYSAESSNIYAKPIIKGESTYKLSEEEKNAIEIAKKSEGIYEINI